jgi:hypothetical protein
MKAFGLINMGVLPLLLEAMTPAYAQHDQREQEARRPNPQQEARPERQQPNPAHQEPQARPQRPEERPQPPAVRPQRQPEPARPAPQQAQERDRGQRERQQNARAQQEHRQQPAQIQPEQRPREQPRQPQTRRPAPQRQRDYMTQHGATWTEHRAEHWQSQHRTWQDRGGYSGYRIPTSSYRSHFGPRHGFRMSSFPLLVVGGFPRFQFGGLWFSVIDPWPEYWSAGWYGDDDMYIESWGGGYYLLNRRYPSDRIAIMVYQR